MIRPLRFAHSAGKLASLLLFMVVTLNAAAVEAPLPKPAAPAPAAAAATVADPNVAVEALQYSLKPLTKDDLTAELTAWMGVLKQQVADISTLQIKALAAQGPEKEQLVAEIAKQQNQRTALLDRVKTVISAFKAKGGDAAVQEKYLDAVSGIEVKANDAGGAFTLMHNWLISSEGGLRWLRNIIFFVLTLFVFSMLSRALGRAAEVALARVKGTSDLLKNFLVNVIHKVTWIIGLVVALSMIEVDIGPLVAAIGATGFVVGFALQNTLSNFAAGIMLLLYRPFDIGNTVKVAGGSEGVVKDMSLVSTTLKTGDGDLVVVPNSAIWSAVIVNKQAV